MLVTRVNRQEAEREIFKFKKCSVLLSDPNESWANFDFAAYITTDFFEDEASDDNFRVNTH